ncbi:sodium channel protein Nach [Glossina fuscipes]|uniref:Sodium channel protein Nach n=1 Tax=Glossina fuscipes TaxID=7396 RepID=A0A8U0WH24_9MUSC|nr:sodium channel protein Nach [Glossina fuscipes]
MKLGNLKRRDFIDNAVIFRRSLIYQTKEFFENSTLHGVRYIAETGRPTIEKFMWFCFTAIGTVIALVIIMSLWEKFQTNPTITGLDTDFHNQNVIFPTTVVCPVEAWDHNKTYNFVYNTLANYEESAANRIVPFLESLPNLNFENLHKTVALGILIGNELNGRTLRQWAFQVTLRCEDTLAECKFRDEYFECCKQFLPIYTEHGFCYAFNSRFYSKEDSDLKTEVQYDLYETDKKWALLFELNVKADIYVFSNEDYFGKEFNPQVTWDLDQFVEVRISKKSTYTTDESRQLSISQRKCIFYDEVKLQYFPDDYTFSSCMKECRMRNAIKLCKCLPPFYRPTPDLRYCDIKELSCLEKHKQNITRNKDCRHCELGCSKTVYNIEKLMKSTENPAYHGVLVEFLTWPIIRYKREVLFGWVDLLVSFGGIAGLFLGFSLLSGVEIIYYFTIRACCMVYKNRVRFSKNRKNFY